GKVTGEDTSPNFANYNSICYIKKGGQFYTAGGRQGFMEERIFSLNQGKFTLEHEISYSNSKTKGEIKDCIYDGQPVNTAQHDSNLNKDFDFSNAILPAESKIDSKHGEIVEVEKEYTYSELVEILSN
ncbi:MAG: hypothetical protein MJ189_02835, partial [Coriobacteriales bacterium]|nr:hypothetical protein [Coriobacteriales bacterium]